MMRVKINNINFNFNFNDIIAGNGRHSKKQTLQKEVMTAVGRETKCLKRIKIKLRQITRLGIIIPK